jgi:hypothetical protein
MAIVPDVVIGEPLIDNAAGTLTATLVTVPEPPPPPPVVIVAVVPLTLRVPSVT